jgi:hypothetical protein
MTFFNKYIKYKNKYFKLKYKQSDDQKYNISFNINSTKNKFINQDDMSFFNKYIKYKQKYLILKSEQFGGSFLFSSTQIVPKIDVLISDLETKIINFIGAESTLKNKDELQSLLKEITTQLDLIKKNYTKEYNKISDQIMPNGKFNLDITIKNFYNIFTNYYKNDTTEELTSTKIKKKCTNNCINCNALLVQCMWGNFETVKWLINKGSSCILTTCFSNFVLNITLKNETGESPLMAAILSKTDDKLQKIKLLADKGVEVNSDYINLAIFKLDKDNTDDKKEETIQLLTDIKEEKEEKEEK